MAISYTPVPYPMKLHITWDRLVKIGNDAEKGIPLRNNRQRFIARNTAMYNACIEKSTRIETYNIGDEVAYISSCQFSIGGETALEVNKGTIWKVTPKTCYINDAYRPMYKILGKLPTRH